jgi:hypothetical protein
MNEGENDFEMLRRLLALKRHEVPPPGYFNGFSGEVIRRICAGEASAPASISEQLFAEAPWWMRLFQSFVFKPAFAGAFASMLFLLLVFGIVFADRPDSAPQPLLQTEAQNDSGNLQLAAVSPMTLPDTPVHTGIIASTNPVLSLQPVTSLFSQQEPLAIPVEFSPSGN